MFGHCPKGLERSKKMKIIYLQSLINIEQAYLLKNWGYKLIPGHDKFGNKIVTISLED